jgi:hypothetical protein
MDQIYERSNYFLLNGDRPKSIGYQSQQRLNAEEAFSPIYIEDNRRSVL